MSETLLSLPEVARRLDISLDQALTLVERKALPADRGVDGGVYVREDDVASYARAHATA